VWDVWAVSPGLNGELLQDGLTGQPALAALADDIVNAGLRAATLVRQLLLFSRKQELPTMVLDLGPVFRDIQDMLIRLIGEHITLRVDTPTQALPIRGTRGQIEQIIFNLVTNARDALPDGGTVAVVLREVAVEQASIGAIDQLPPGPYVVISVSDTGTGMTAEVMSRAIDPFFTTKEVGSGTGLGLSIVYGIARKIGGGLRLASALGSGTRVDVFLPLATGAPPRDEPAVVATAEGGRERVLVVEDDDAVARVVLDVLGAHGYHLRRAGSGVEALQLCRDAPDTIDLVVTDVIMPRMGGPALVAALRAGGIRIPVLFMSGYTNNALQSLYGLAEEVELLEKPFTPRELLARVRSVLDRRA
jgi:CheY-like chemotaxis protein